MEQEDNLEHLEGMANIGPVVDSSEDELQQAHGSNGGAVGTSDDHHDDNDNDNNNGSNQEREKESADVESADVVVDKAVTVHDVAEETKETNDESSRITETTLRDGIPIPKDSALFTPLDITYNPLNDSEVSADVLIKANLASLPLNLQAHETLPIRIQFLIHSIPLLDNIATQILRIIGVGPYEETLAIITSEEPTPEGLVYKDLVEIFEQVKKVFSDEDPFLGFHNLIENVDNYDLSVLKNLKELEDNLDSAFRKSNLATFLLATLGSIEVGFFYLNESFLDVFCPTYNNGWFKKNQNQINANNNYNNATSAITAGKLLKAQAGLFLELKTQAYISALESGDRSKEEVLEDIFPDYLRDQLLQRRRTADLTPAEQDFLQRCKSRRDTLLATPDDQDLSEIYEWLIFLKELFNYVSKNIGFLIWGRKGRHQELTAIGFESRFSTTSSSPTASNSALSSYASLSKKELQEKLRQQKLKEKEAKERADRIDRELSESKRSNNNNHQPKPKQSSTSSSSTTSTARRQQKPTSTNNPPRLRHILRRPWSGEEENALIDALKELGPQWSKILELHGAGGVKSEALKNRTQVQLKDKARNWKMGFLKNKGKAPDYLSKVTGDLGDDRSTRKRKREATPTNSNNTNQNDKRSKSPVAIDDALLKESNQSQSDSIIRQESSVRMEDKDEGGSQSQEKQQTTTAHKEPSEVGV